MARDLRGTHLMVTHRATRITKLVNRLQLSVATSPMLSPVLTSISSVLIDHHSRCTMEEEYEILLANNILALVPLPPRANLVTRN
jgi:hypothetical protein